MNHPFKLEAPKANKGDDMNERDDEEMSEDGSEEMSDSSSEEIGDSLPEICFEYYKKPHDLTIICGGVKFKVHKEVICPKSKFFAVACWTEMKEKESGVIMMPEQDPVILTSLIHFAYKGDYDDGHANNPQYEGLPARNARVYALGEEYGMTTLKDEAFEKFEALAKEGFDHNDFFNAVKAIYTLIPCHDVKLRQIVAKLYANHMNDHPEAEELLKTKLDIFQGFAADVASAQVVKSKVGSRVKTYRCSKGHRARVVSEDNQQTRHCPVCGIRAYYDFDKLVPIAQLRSAERKNQTPKKKDSTSNDKIQKPKKRVQNAKKKKKEIQHNEIPQALMQAKL